MTKKNIETGLPSYATVRAALAKLPMPTATVALASLIAKHGPEFESGLLQDTYPTLDSLVIAGAPVNGFGKFYIPTFEVVSTGNFETISGGSGGRAFIQLLKMEPNATGDSALMIFGGAPFFERKSAQTGLVVTESGLIDVVGQSLSNEVQKQRLLGVGLANGEQLPALVKAPRAPKWFVASWGAAEKPGDWGDAASFKAWLEEAKAAKAAKGGDDDGGENAAEVAALLAQMGL